MKISHRDFRPPRRSKYVTQPLKRRPTLRILLLAGIAVVVYLKFDAVVSSRAFQKLRKPFLGLSGKMKSLPAPQSAQAGFRWAPDSSAVEAECASPQADSCLEGWTGLGMEAAGGLRAAIQKAKMQWDVDAASGFTVRFLRIARDGGLLDPHATGLELTRLELRGNKGTVTLTRQGGGNPSSLCALDRCLDARHPQAPFPHFRNIARAPSADPAEARIPQATFLSTQGQAARPILPGRILDLPSAAGGTWMKIYHGENIFSYYRGFTRPKAGLRAGSMVNMNDTLGLLETAAPPQGASVAGEAAAGLEVRIEKDGIMVDPIAWMGLAQGDDAGNPHGR